MVSKKYFELWMFLNFFIFIDIWKGMNNRKLCLLQCLNLQSVTLHTDLGDLKIELFCEDTPKASEVRIAYYPHYCKSTWRWINERKTYLKGYHKLPRTASNLWSIRKCQKSFKRLDLQQFLAISSLENDSKTSIFIIIFCRTF